MLSRTHVLHLRPPLYRCVFSSVYSCPCGQRVLLRFGSPVSPRWMFIAHVTGSVWYGFAHDRTRQRWSSCNPAGIGPRKNSNMYLCAPIDDLYARSAVLRHTVTVP